MEIDYFKYVDNFSRYKDVNSKLIISGKINNPKVTIAIPTYKRNHLIKDAIDSAINQVNFDNYEVIIVDNDGNFEDKELENIIREYKSDKIFYYKNEKNIGMFGNWNRCIELAKGEYISILHDDDWLEKNFLIETLKSTEKNKAVFTEAIVEDFRNQNYIMEKKYLKKYLKIIYFKLKKLKKIRNLTMKDFFYRNRSFGTLGVLFNKLAMINIGGYNEEFFPTGDYIFHTNYCHKYGSLLLKEKLSHYRIQENESMKREIVILWIKQGRKFRKFLIKTYLKKEKYFEECDILTEIAKQGLIFWEFNFDYNKKLANKKIKIKLREWFKNIF